MLVSWCISLVRKLYRNPSRYTTVLINLRRLTKIFSQNSVSGNGIACNHLYSTFSKWQSICCFSLYTFFALSGWTHNGKVISVHLSVLFICTKWIPWNSVIGDLFNSTRKGSLFFQSCIKLEAEIKYVLPYKKILNLYNFYSENFWCGLYLTE
jgi:hypothetical protein